MDYYTLLRVFHTCLNRLKFESPQVSRTLLGILADFNNAIIWMVSTRPLIPKSSSHSINHYVTVPRSPITIGITVNIMFHSLFSSQTGSWYLSFFSLSFNFTQWSAVIAKYTIQQVFLLLLIITISSHLAEIR